MISPLLSLSWKDHSNSLTTVCKTLLDNNFLVDCTIAAEGQCLKAHRLILSACSPYFQMLFNEEREKHPIVFLKDVSFDSLKAVINFVYHGETQILEANLKGFLELAESLQIKGLNNSIKDRCKPVSCVDVKDNPECSRDNQKVLEVQSTSASQEECIGSAPEHSLYHSGDHTDTVESNSSVLLEEHNNSWEGVKSPRVVTPSQEQHVSHLPIEFSVDTQTIVKEEPLHSECLVPKCEQTDEYNELRMQNLPHDNTCDLNEVGAPIFAVQNLHEYSRIASPYMESSDVLPDVVTYPQTIVPPNVQGLVEALGAGPPGRVRSRRADVWRYFAEMEGSQGRRVVCRLCGAATTRPTGATNNMRHHLRAHHPCLLAAGGDRGRAEPRAPIR